MSESNKILLYGANGYSAKLILEEFIKRGINPVLGGRNGKEIKDLAHTYSCDYKIFDLSDPEFVKEQLSDFKLLLNCAGPFKYTAEILMDACIKAKTHYLDITGEIPVIELAWSKTEAAEKAGVILLPSVGFDVIPTDCLAKRLSEKMPGAVSLQLGLITKNGKISRGTWRTTIEMMAGEGKIRSEGKIVDSIIGKKKISVTNDKIKFRGISIPWGDVSSAYYSTGIPNIEVYLAVPKTALKYSKSITLLQKVLRIDFLRNGILFYMKKRFYGPTEEERNAAKTYVWGRVSNAEGKTLEETARVMEGYNLTALGAVESTQRILEGNISPGAKTPSLAFGSEFLDMFLVNGG